MGTTMSIVCQISEAMQKGRAKLVKELISAALEEGSPQAKANRTKSCNDLSILV